MRLFLVLLMFKLLLLQFPAAAAAADCCGHAAASQETSNQHHQPIHPSEDAAEQELASVVLGSDLDCGTCHDNCAAAVMATTVNLADLAGIERGEHFVELVLPPWHEQPYRPQWSVLQGSGMNAFA